MPYTYKWSELSKSLLPTIKKATEAIKQADNDDPKYRDQRNLASLLMRLPRANPRLGGNINTRRTALTSFSHVVTATDSADAQKAIEAQRRIDPVVKLLKRWHTDAAMYGAACIELNWNTANTLGTTPIITRRLFPVELERPSSLESDLIIIESTPTAATKTPIATLRQTAPQAYITQVDENFDCGGVLRSLVYKNIILNEMIQEWSNTAKKVKGIIETIFKQDAPPEEIQEAKSSLANLVRNNYSVHSDAIEYAFKDTVASQAVNTFKDLVNMLFELNAIAINGQANTTALPTNGGSRAALQIMQMISADICYSDILNHEDTINNQLLLFDFQLNHDPKATSTPWKYAVVVPEEIDLESRARTIQIALDAGLELNSTEIYSMLGFTLPENFPATIKASGVQIPMI